MVSKRKHLDVARFFIDEPFKSKRPGRNSGVPSRDRNQHGSYLAGLYQNLINAYDQKRKQQIDHITDDSGIYVEIIGVDGCKLPLDSLDNRDFKLCSCQMRGDREFALIFIPEDRRDTFLKKIRQYLDPQKDGKPNNKGVSFPRNHTLIDSISEIRLANLESFWTDPIELFPTDRNLDVWWELWLKSNTVDDVKKIAESLAERVDGRLGNTSLSFFNSFVVLIKASVNKLEKAPELISNLEEIRKAKDTPVPIISSSPKEQQECSGMVNLVT